MIQWYFDYSFVLDKKYGFMSQLTLESIATMKIKRTDSFEWDILRIWKNLKPFIVSDAISSNDLQ